VEWLFPKLRMETRKQSTLDVDEGGSKSERERSGVPLPKGDPSTGAVEKGKGGSTNAETADSRYA
jgi:hypothetical protein